ncbi:hypothetical protein CIK90_00645, partial [Prevotella sp. P5-126]|uniref:hypothetical protein n=1 Tax=Prevotella sp. P5-126 TaxID=2024216 RepID=UPI000B96411B
IVLFREAYENCLYPVFEYYGYKLENTEFVAKFISNILAFIPILLYKPQNHNVSDFISILIYVMIYVPTLLGLQYYYVDYASALPYQLAYLLAMCVFFSASRNKSSNKKFSPPSFYISKNMVVSLGVLVLLVTFIVFRNNMQLVSFDSVYDIRTSGTQLADSIPVYSYLYAWMSTVFSPLFVTLGCVKNKKIYIYLGFFMSLVFYMTCGMKSTFFIPLLSLFLYKYLKKDADNFYYIFPLLSIGIAIPYVLYLLFDSRIVEILVGLIIMRTFGISAYLTPIYIDVFNRYPYTYYSHIRIIDAITGMYPFETHSLGNEVNLAYGTADAEAQINANFLVTDGIAAGGIGGIIFITILFYFFLVFINRLCKSDNYYTAIAMLTGAAISLTNNSLFTTLLSSGLLFVICVIRFVKIDSK